MAENITILDINVDKKKVPKDGFRVIECLRPTWKEGNVKTKVYTEGYVNVMVSFRLDSDPDMGDAIMIRVFSSAGDSFASRDKEFLVMQLAHAAGAFPAILAGFGNGIAYKFVIGRTLCGLDFCTPKIIRTVARTLAQFHYVDINKVPLVDREGKPVTFSDISTMSEYCRNSIKKIPTKLDDPDRDARYQQNRKSIEQIRDEFEALESDFRTYDIPMVLRHGDFHYKNIVYDESTDTCQLLDFELSMFGFRTVDLCVTRMHTMFQSVDMIGKDDPRIGDIEMKLWSRHYLEKVMELQGKDPRKLTEKDVEKLVLEIDLSLQYQWKYTEILTYMLANDTSFKEDVLEDMDMVHDGFSKAAVNYPALKEIYLNDFK